MDYREYSPPKELSHIIECFWTITLYPVDFQQHYDYYIPDGSTDAIFMLNGNYLRDDERRNDKHLVDYCSLIPAFQKAVKVHTKPYTSLLGARFKPGAILSLTGHSLADLDKPTYPLQDLMPELADLAMEEALKKTQPVVIIDKMNSWLLKKVSTPRENHVVFAFISETMKTRGAVVIKDFCKSFGIHKSILEKNFKHYTGLSPKQYANLIRFNFLIQKILFSGSSLTEISYELHYFDQSHMIKDFRKVIGYSPLEFLEKKFTVPKLAAMAISNKSKHFNITH